MENSYDRLTLKKIDVIKLLNWHFEKILKSINRKITFRQKYKNPWAVEVTEVLHRDIFIQAFIAIRDFAVEFGRTLKVVRDKKGTGTHYTITFSHLGCLRYHLHKLSGLEKSNIDNLFKKVDKTKGKAEIEVSEERTAILSFNCKKSLLKLNLSYKVINRYGVTCSF